MKIRRSASRQGEAYQANTPWWKVRTSRRLQTWIRKHSLSFWFWCSCSAVAVGIGIPGGADGWHVTIRPLRGTELTPMPVEPTTAFLCAGGLHGPCPRFFDGGEQGLGSGEGRSGGRSIQPGPWHATQSCQSSADARLRRFGGGATDARTLLVPPNTSFTVPRNSSTV
jgi:hypothetical protein